MSIVKRATIIIICASIALFLLAYFGTNYLFLRGFGDLERKTIEKNTRQAADALTVELKELDTFCQDWASWDDTYNFAKNGNQEYIDRNLIDGTFINYDISLFAVLNTKGNLVFNKAYDILNGQEIALPADFASSLPDGGMLQPLDMQSAISGTIMLSGQPVQIAERPVFTSVAEGPSTGFLIVGRFLDSGVISKLSQTTSLSVDLLAMQDASQNPGLNKAFGSLNSPDAVYVQVQNSNTIAGYTLVKDLNGSPAFVIKVTIPRDIYSRGVKLTAYVHLGEVFAFVVFCVIFLLLARNLVLTRLTLLTNAVSAIGSKGETSSRVSMKGHDELSTLADNINGMLESLEKSEATRQSQKELIGDIIANTPNAILAIDASDKIILVNKSFRTMFDLADTKMMNSKVNDLPGLSLLIQEFKTFKERRAMRMKKELQYPHNGDIRTLIATFDRLKEEEHYVLHITDISEERAAHESLYLKDRLASIGEMASGIAHELNNPLTIIMGLSELIALEKVPESVKEDVGVINSESQRAAAIVKKLLSFARKNTAIKQPTAINQILLDVLKLRSFEHGAGNITVLQELDPTLTDIMADSSQIEQVFLNIIVNAEQAMVSAHGKGTLKIKTELAGNMVTISFKDDGPGIEARNLRRIFDPFFTTKESGKGTGLGLSISYGIVSEHHGQIYAVSKIGKGTTFVVELPLHNNNQKAK